jgi:hypothetical protein
LTGPFTGSGGHVKSDPAVRISPYSHSSNRDLSSFEPLSASSRRTRRVQRPRHLPLSGSKISHRFQNEIKPPFPRHIRCQSRTAAVSNLPDVTELWAADSIEASFSAMRDNEDSLANEREVASVCGQVWKFIRAHEQTATSFTIRSCFRKEGLSPNTQTRPFKLEFNKEALRQNDGFKELWDRNISIAELSRHRQLQKFGIPNTEFLDA